jgi:N-glycosylase/DNA lyase
MKELMKQYQRKKRRIRQRLEDFRQVWKMSEKDLFSELCFCVCTPQSKAVYCDKAVKNLKKKDMLFNGKKEDIRKGLKAVRFPNNKAGYIIHNRGVFNGNGRVRIKEKIDINDIPGTRDWLVKNVKGIGYKEASHFLRNIGQGEDLAILDVHILRNMVKYKVIREIPKTISKRTYIELEKKLRSFARKLNMSMGELDILFWSNQTGIIFK